MDKKLNLFGVIYPYDDYVNAQDVSKFLASLKSGEKFTVYINSPGGSVFEGLTIYNLLSEYASQMTIKIIGEASSIASVIACAGAEGRTLIAETALMLIHKPWTFTIVDEDYLDKLQKELGTIKGSIIKAYQRKTGKPEDELNDMMKEAEYHGAKECVEVGFADKVYIPSEADSTIETESDKKVKENLSKFMIMNLNQKSIPKPNKEKATMTLDEALKEIGTLRNQVETFEKAAGENDKKLSKQEAELKNLTETNSKLTESNEALAKANKEFQAKLDAQQQELVLSEETEFCNKLISDMKLAPAEKDTTIKILVNFRNNKDVMFDNDTSMYDHLRASFEAREALTSLKKDGQAPKNDGSESEFEYKDELLETAEGRGQLDAEIKKRMAANDSDYSTELEKIKQGV